MSEYKKLPLFRRSKIIGWALVDPSLFDLVRTIRFGLHHTTKCSYARHIRKGKQIYLHRIAMAYKMYTERVTQILEKYIKDRDPTDIMHELESLEMIRFTDKNSLNCTSENLYIPSVISQQESKEKEFDELSPTERKVLDEFRKQQTKNDDK